VIFRASSPGARAAGIPPKGSRRAPRCDTEADEPLNLTPQQIRRILRQRRFFPKRPCQCCGRVFQPLGRWNCRCLECHALQDEWQPARMARALPARRNGKEQSL
jgi:hypothetical protein